MQKTTFDSSTQAEHAFYKALQNNDLQLMMQVWDTSDDIVCIHPLGARLQGRRQIHRSWQQLFGSNTRLQFVISDLQQQISAGLASHLLVENITLGDHPQRLSQAMLATNIYRLGDAGWRMIVHHASPAPQQAPQSVSPPPPLH